MKRLACLAILIFASLGFGQDVPLELRGDTVTVKVAKQITVYEDRVVIKSFTPTPLIIAQPDIGFYYWTYPAVVKAVDKGNVLQINSAPQGDYTINLKIQSAVVDDKGKIKYVTKFSDIVVSVGVPGPTPVPPIPPTPVPPEPVPPIPPTPVPVTSFRVIYVTESANTLTSAQRTVIDAKITRDYLTANTTPEGKWSGWRQYDPQQNVTNEQPNMKALWEAVQPKLTTLPCVVIEVNGKADILPLEATPAAQLEVFKKYKSGGV